MSGLLGKSNIGGGAKLAYRVFDGLTRPSNPKEGDIWVETGVRITHFEFSANWSGASVGTVCVYGSVGGSNPSASNNTIYVYDFKVRGVQNREKMTPVYCMQVQGSAGNWKRMNAYVYHSGTWVQFSFARLYLFNQLDYATSVTGGWEAVGWRYDSASTSAAAKAPTITTYTKSITWSVSQGAGGWRTKNAMDLTGYDVIHVVHETVTGTITARFYNGSYPSYYGSNTAASKQLSGNHTSFNLPSTKNNLRLAICGSLSSGTISVRGITQIYVESTRQQTDETIMALAALQSEHDIEIASLIDEIYQEDLGMINA